MAKAQQVYALDQQTWLDFRKEFEDRGFRLKCIFRASDEIRIWVVSDGPDGKQPKHRTFMTRHYLGGGGFGVWLESRTGKIKEGVDEVIDGLLDAP